MGAESQRDRRGNDADEDATSACSRMCAASAAEWDGSELIRTGNDVGADDAGVDCHELTEPTELGPVCDDA